jgi:hypothetical protein
MTCLIRGLFALTIWIMLAGPCWGQRFIPIRPPRIPVTPMRLPHLPISPIQSAYQHSGNQAESDSGGSGVLFGVLAGLAAFIALIIGFTAWMDRTVAHLRIVRTPPGEAPEEIRRAWVGVELPLRTRDATPQNHPTLGVLSYRSSQCETAHGYSVDSRAALKALANHSPTAADWWRKYAPQVFERGNQLWFPPEVCEVIATPMNDEERR